MRLICKHLFRRGYYCKTDKMALYDKQISHHAVHQLHPSLTDFIYHIKFETLEDLDVILKNYAAHIVQGPNAWT